MLKNLIITLGVNSYLENKRDKKYLKRKSRYI